MFGLGVLTFEQGFVGEAVVNHLVDGAPVGKAAEVAVVDKDVGLDLAGEVAVTLGFFFGIITVYGVKLQAALTTKGYGFVEKLALTHAPQDDAVTFGGEFLQGLDGKGNFFPYLGVTVFDDGS